MHGNEKEAGGLDEASRSNKHGVQLWMTLDRVSEVPPRARETDGPAGQVGAGGSSELWAKGEG